MMTERRTTVLVVERDAEMRLRYNEALRVEGFLTHAVDSPLAAEVALKANDFDIVAIDSELAAADLAVVERLAARSKRPRLVLVTSRVPNGAPMEWLFDVYFEKPCPPEALTEAVASVHIPVAKSDLLVVSRERVGIGDVLERFGGNTATIEVRVDLRRSQRRRRSRFLNRQDRRRAERRALDVDHWLRADGWAFVPAAARG